MSEGPGSAGAPLHWWTARDLAAAIRRRELSAREVVAWDLDRIERVNPRINAIVSLRPQAALAEADAADRRAGAGEPLGPLHGLPIAIKDLEDTAGLRTTYGSAAFAEHVPDQDSLLVARLKQADPITAAASATRRRSTMSWACGRRRAWCPTAAPGRVGHGVGGGAAGADGGRSGADAHRDQRAGRPQPALPRKPCGLPRRSARGAGRAPDRLVSRPRRAADRARGHRRPGRRPRPAHRARLRGPGRRAGSQRRRRGLRDPAALAFARGFGPSLAALRGVAKDTLIWNIEQGLALDGPAIARAMVARSEVFTTVADLLQRFDLLAAPSAQVAPFPIEEEYPLQVAGVAMPHYLGWMRVCSRITVSAHPVAAAPAGFTADGLPVGLQLVGRYRGDRRLLEHAAAWEAASGLSECHPPLD
jgi:amidase